MGVQDKEGLVILMADESIEDHKLVKKAARNCNVNHVFTSVYNGSQLMDYLNKKGVYYTSSETRPDLIIMDARLPVIDSFTILEKIMSDEQLKNIPVYVLTKDIVEEEKARVMAMGVKNYFKKPLKFDDLQGIIHGICRMHFPRKD
jgi:CheY-like chemotaxis protein